MQARGFATGFQSGRKEEIYPKTSSRAKTKTIREMSEKKRRQAGFLRKLMSQINGNGIY